MTSLTPTITVNHIITQCKETYLEHCVNCRDYCKEPLEHFADQGKEFYFRKNKNRLHITTENCVGKGEQRPGLGLGLGLGLRREAERGWLVEELAGH